MVTVKFNIISSTGHVLHFLWSHLFLPIGCFAGSTQISVNICWLRPYMEEPGHSHFIHHPSIQLFSNTSLMFMLLKKKKPIWLIGTCLIFYEKMQPFLGLFSNKLRIQAVNILCPFNTLCCWSSCGFISSALWCQHLYLLFLLWCRKLYYSFHVPCCNI